jgi:hypothetical protein
VNWLAYALMYIATLVFVAYLIWLWRFTKSPKQEIAILRQEVNGLAMSMGLKRASMGPGPMPPGPPRIS